MDREMELNSLGEFGLIRRIASAVKVPDGVLGIGDDCATLPQKEGMETLVTTDMLVEGSHFLLDDIPAYMLGWKSAAVNISDIAAMGGRPSASFLSLALPGKLGSEWLDEFMQGYLDLSKRYGCTLLGGDTTSSPDRLCINVTVLGESVHGQAKLRSGAVPGDLICVSGPLGDSAGGLRVILDRLERGADEKELVRRHYAPLPRVSEGLALAATEGVHAMMDISDGIGSDLRHILEASGTGAEVDLKALPLSDELRHCCERHGWDPYRLACSGGEDYELLFTAAPDTELPTWAKVIGRITDGSELKWTGSDEDYGGFAHF